MSKYGQCERDPTVDKASQLTLNADKMLGICGWSC